MRKVKVTQDWHQTVRQAIDALADEDVTNATTITLAVALDEVLTGDVPKSARDWVAKAARILRNGEDNGIARARSALQVAYAAESD
jgi:hypothetical protein